MVENEEKSKSLMYDIDSDDADENGLMEEHNDEQTPNMRTKNLQLVDHHDPVKATKGKMNV